MKHMGQQLLFLPFNIDGHNRNSVLHTDGTMVVDFPWKNNFERILSLFFSERPAA